MFTRVHLTQIAVLVLRGALVIAIKDHARQRLAVAVIRF